MNTLPTDRDLPPAAREALRTRVVDTVGRRPPSRRWVPLAAAAALVAIVGGTAVAVSVTGRDAPATPTATRAATPTATPTATPVDRNAYRVLPLGLTRFTPDGATRTQVAGCGPSFDKGRILLAVRMRYARLAVIAPSVEAFTCSLPTAGNTIPFGGSGSSSPTEPPSPVPSPVRYEGVAEGVLDEGTFLSTTQGKVTAAVKRVTLTYGHQKVDAVIGNGVFFGGAILQYGPSRPLPDTVSAPPHSSFFPNPLPEPTVRGYDAAGKLLYDSSDMIEDRSGRGDVSCVKGPGRCRYPWP